MITTMEWIRSTRIVETVDCSEPSKEYGEKMLNSLQRAGAALAKKPYAPPKLTVYGTLPEMTKGLSHKGQRDGASRSHKTL